MYYLKYHLFHEGIPKKTRKMTKRQRWMENLAKRNVERLEGELGSINIFVKDLSLKKLKLKKCE